VLDLQKLAHNQYPIQKREDSRATSDINRVNEMLNIHEATALSHILTRRNMPFDRLVEPSDFNTGSRIIRMPEGAQFLPLRRIATVPFGDDDLFDSEAVESVVWLVLRGGLPIETQHILGDDDPHVERIGARSRCAIVLPTWRQFFVH